MQASLSNLQYPLSQQFYTLRDFLKSGYHSFAIKNVRFRPKIRVYGNHRHGCSLQATTNWRISNDVELVGLQNYSLRFSKLCNFRKITKIFNLFFSFLNLSPSKSCFFKKLCNMLQGNGWLISAQNFKSIAPKMVEIWHKSCKKTGPIYVISAP